MSQVFGVIDSLMDSALIWALVFLAVALLVSGVKIVPQAHRMVVERLGKFHRILTPGVNVIFPVLDRTKKVEWYFGASLRSTASLDMREQVLDFPKQNIISKDNVVMEINALLYFQISDPFKAIYEIANLPLALEKLTQTSLRSVMGEMELDEIFSKRSEINERLRTTLDEASDVWGVKVSRVEIQDVNPPASVQEAMQRQMEAERTRRAVVTEANGQRDAEMNRAEGRKRAIELEAEGKANARIRLAQAEAEALSAVAVALSAHGGKDPAAYLIAVKYLESLKEMAAGDGTKTVYLPYEASSILSSVGAMKEVFK
ncbi:MAG: hypothetical protein CSA35_01725 [Dethiosulfovibrio peptidovorans]|nr:MAG: hypothetical protein CSA35_01725 [Dethiosulfovibrio peptidovorans]